MFLSCMGYSLHSGPTPRGRFESADRVSTARPGVAASMASRTISDLTIMLNHASCSWFTMGLCQYITSARKEPGCGNSSRKPSFRGKSGTRTSFLPGKQFLSFICSSSSSCCALLLLLILSFVLDSNPADTQSSSTELHSAEANNCLILAMPTSVLSDNPFLPLQAFNTGFLLLKPAS
jgi:hypothetical protein